MTNNIKKKLLNVLSTLVIVFLAVVALMVIISRIQNRVFFVFGRTTVVWVMTDSMEDTIPEQSYILIEKVTDAEKQVEVGDIITFHSQDPAITEQLNTHRVERIDLNTHRVERIDKEKGCFYTKGDNNVAEDTVPVPYDRVEGKYVKNLPGLSKVGRFLMSPPGFTIVSLALLAMICAVYVPEIVKAVKKTTDPDKENVDSEHEKEMQRRIAEEVERLKQQEQSNQEQSDQDETPSKQDEEPTKPNQEPSQQQE